MMRTTLDLEGELLDRVAQLTGEKSKSKAVAKALEEFVYRKALEELDRLAGTINLVENWRELREMEKRKLPW